MRLWLDQEVPSTKLKIIRDCKKAFHKIRLSSD
jgi:hypothetical protein